MRGAINVHNPRPAGILPLLIVLGVLLSAASAAGTAKAEEPGAPPLTVRIGDIRYEGGEAYSVVVTISTSSHKDVLVKIVEEGFFMQTDRNWARLPMKQVEGENGEFLLPRNGSRERKASIHIDPGIPDLFRTYEGDLSLRYQYSYAVRTMDQAGAVFQKRDEVYCWVKPGTSEWILREGM